jgi:hypothetical protein
MGNENYQNKRASNIIWNASYDYSFDSEWKAYDEDGKADLYLNFVIGSVRKYYDFELLQSFFDNLKTYSRREFFEELMWIGLENGVF